MHANLIDNSIAVFDSYLYKDSIKEISGRRWDALQKAWIVPCTSESVATLKILGCQFQGELVEIAERLSVSTPTIEVSSTPLDTMPIKATPFAHQTQAYNMACTSTGIFDGNRISGRGFALLMEMGTGKTLTSVAIIGRAYLNNLINRVMIVAPKSVVPVWANELSKYADYPFSAVSLEGSSEKKTQLLKNLSGAGVHISAVNYESVALIEKAIISWKPDFIVCDESSRIKNPQAKQSKAIHRIAKLCKYRLILTGTPIQNNPLDFYSQYKVLDEKLFGSSFYAFKNTYAILGNYNQPVGYRNLPDLVAKAHSIAYRVTKADALDLPETVDDIRYIVLEPKAETLYRQLVKDSYAELSKGEVTATNVLTRLLRLQQTTGGFLKSDDGVRVEQISKAKLEALEDIVDDVTDAGKKVVVFARFTAEINAICKMLEKKKIGYALVSGATKDREEEVRKFQDDRDFSVFIGQIQTSALGLTLTAADTAVFYSANFNYVDFSQSKARIHRIGQKNKCTYIYLVVKGTIDETILAALANKEDISKTLVDNWRSLITGGNQNGE